MVCAQSVCKLKVKIKIITAGNLKLLRTCRLFDGNARSWSTMALHTTIAQRTNAGSIKKVSDNYVRDLNNILLKRNLCRRIAFCSRSFVASFNPPYNRRISSGSLISAVFFTALFNLRLMFGMPYLKFFHGSGVVEQT